jgi:dipeptidyl aminopeptidase/acylaminoacyl peptidase
MRGMVPEDVYELTGASDPRVSPDGRTVAFVVWRLDKESNATKGNIWLAAADGSTPRRQFTAGDALDADPRWSPDGSRLAFTSKRGTDAAQLFVIPVAGGEARKLTDLKEDVQQPTWSPDGSRLAFTARVPDPANDEKDERKRAPRRLTRLAYKLDNEGWTIDRPHHVFTVAADGSGEPTQLTFGDYEDVRPAWSPDGTRIAFVSARHADWDIAPGEDIHLVPSDGGEPTTLTATDGFATLPSWSADGTRIAYAFTPGLFDDPRHAQIAVVDVESGERRLLTETLDRNSSPYPEMREPIWDGEDLVFAVEDAGNTHLYRVPADGSEAPERFVGGDVSVTGFDLAGGTLAHTVTTPTSLAEVFVGERKLTDVGAGFAEGRELVAPERFVAVSPDGTEVEGWVIRPAGFDEGRTYPTMLNIHGGPFTQYGNKFFDEFQVYAGAGYAVVYCNPRGSSGYSEAWGRAIRGPVEGGPGWGTVDYEDVMAVMDEAIKRFDFVDADRLGVMGGSYGGYMTSWIVGHNDRFRAAVSERAVNNLLSEGGSSDIAIWWKGYIGAHPWEAPEAYRQMSPSTYAKDITTPLLILHSENDLRCPVGQGEDLFLVLRALKRDVEMVRFPAEGHELSRSGSPIHRVTRFEIILDWWGRHLSAD